MSISRALRAFAVVVISFIAIVSVRAAGPTSGGGLVQPQSPATLKLAPFYVGDDGGAFYVREREGTVFWFAEHPGRNYAHVFKGRRNGDRITGRFYSVPKGSVTAAGAVAFRIRNDSNLEIDGAVTGFSARVLRPRALVEVLQELPGPTPPRFGSPSQADLDGGFIDEAGRAYYVRQLGSAVVFVAEVRARLREQPQGVFVFVGERNGTVVNGDLIAVPKGVRTLAGSMRLRVLGDGMINADSEAGLFRDVRLRAITPKRSLRMLRAPHPIEVTTRFVDGTEVLDGDIVVSAPSDRFRSAVVASAGRLWKDGFVPYVIDSNVSITARGEIDKAIKQFQSETNLRFIQRSDQPDYIRFKEFPDLFNQKPPCTWCGQSPVGRMGGEQILKVTPDIPSSSVVHEIGHAVGLYHEQSRFDRDNFVTILWDNIAPGGEVQFSKYVTKEMDYGPYDYQSIMHYYATSFGKLTGPNSALTVLVPKKAGETLGNTKLSPHDIRGLEHLYGPVIEVPGVGDRGNGAGIAITNLNGDQRPDIILMAYDDAAGQNRFKYRIGFDVDARGLTAHWSDPISVDGLGERGEGAGIAIADIDHNGRPDMLLLAYDAAEGQNSFKYKIGRDLGADGMTQNWSARRTIPGVGHKGAGAGAAIRDIDHDGDLDLVVMAYDDAQGQGNAFKYFLARNLKVNGEVGVLLGPLRVQGLGERGDGGDLLIADMDGSPRPEMLFMVYDDAEGQNSFKINILHNVDFDAQSQVMTREQYQGVGHRGDGAGIAAADLDGNGIQDLILMAYDSGNEANVFKYKVLRDALQP